jgi:hypothetical protein
MHPPMTRSAALVALTLTVSCVGSGESDDTAYEWTTTIDHFDHWVFGGITSCGADGELHVQASANFAPTYAILNVWRVAEDGTGWDEEHVAGADFDVRGDLAVVRWSLAADDSYESNGSTRAPCVAPEAIPDDIVYALRVGRYGQDAGGGCAAWGGDEDFVAETFRKLLGNGSTILTFDNVTFPLELTDCTLWTGPKLIVAFECPRKPSSASSSLGIARYPLRHPPCPGLPGALSVLHNLFWASPLGLSEL